MLNCFRKYSSTGPLYFFSAAIAADERWILHFVSNIKYIKRQVAYKAAYKVLLVKLHQVFGGWDKDSNILTSQICMVTTYKIPKEFSETGEGCNLESLSSDATADQKIYAEEADFKRIPKQFNFSPTSPLFTLPAWPHFSGKLEIFLVGITDISSLPQGFGPWEVETKQ